MRSQIEALTIAKERGILIDERYTTTAPSIQNVVDIFCGTWTSKLPLEGIQSGETDHINTDFRVPQWNSITPVAGKRILELGPLECYHSYTLEKLGAASVTCIESNVISFLKCLIVKDICKLHTDLRHGDINEYLKDCMEKYDIVLASGVLYHMIDPIQLLYDISNISDVLFLWTHYYSKDRVDLQFMFDNNEPILLHSKYKAHKHFYGEATSNTPYFSGGSKPYCMWLERETIFEALEDAGFSKIVVSQESLDFERGNWLTLTASKT